MSNKLSTNLEQNIYDLRAKLSGLKEHTSDKFKLFQLMIENFSTNVSEANTGINTFWRRNLPGLINK